MCRETEKGEKNVRINRKKHFFFVANRWKRNVNTIKIIDKTIMSIFHLVLSVSYFCYCCSPFLSLSLKRWGDNFHSSSNIIITTKWHTFHYYELVPRICTIFFLFTYRQFVKSANFLFPCIFFFFSTKKREIWTVN